MHEYLLLSLVSSLLDHGTIDTYLWPWIFFPPCVGIALITLGYVYGYKGLGLVGHLWDRDVFGPLGTWSVPGSGEREGVSGF